MSRLGGFRRRMRAIVATTAYRQPSRKLRLIGVTGTNGKTTTMNLIYSILTAAGERAGMIGTIEYRIGDRRLPANYTTPETDELNSLLAMMVREGCSSVAMEVSSHSLALHRVYGLKFDAGLFTNLSHDHLDFHGDMESYFQAKAQFFRKFLPSEGK